MSRSDVVYCLGVSLITRKWAFSSSMTEEASTACIKLCFQSAHTLKYPLVKISNHIKEESYKDLCYSGCGKKKDQTCPFDTFIGTQIHAHTYLPAHTQCTAL